MRYRIVVAIHSANSVRLEEFAGGVITWRLPARHALGVGRTSCCRGLDLHRMENAVERGQEIHFPAL